MNRAERRRAQRAGTTAPDYPIACLAATNAPWAPTGYGTQIKQLARRMLADGIPTAVAANYGLEAMATKWEGIDVLPRGYDPYSSDVIGAYAKDMAHQYPDRAQFVLSLYDVWIYLKHPTWEALQFPVVSWVPIDHDPIPAKVLEWCQRERVIPIAMSQFGGRQLDAAGVEHMVIPHGIETSVYVPTSAVVDANGTSRTPRELLGIPADAHVTGIMNANKGTAPVRKSFDTQIMAWAQFAREHDDAWLYLHTERFGSMQGIPLDPLLEACGAPMDRVVWVNQYQMRMGIPDELMAAYYSGLDVLLAPTLGEGFGLTVAEAAACETPAIVNDFTAQPELVADGWLVGNQRTWDPAQSSWFAIPNVGDILDALRESYARGGTRSPASREHIVAEYDADRLYETGWRALWRVMTP